MLLCEKQSITGYSKTWNVTCILLKTNGNIIIAIIFNFQYLKMGGNTQSILSILICYLVEDYSNKTMHNHLEKDICEGKNRLGLGIQFILN